MLGLRISRVTLPLSDGCAGRLVHHPCWAVIVRSCGVTRTVRPPSFGNSRFFHSIAWTRINCTLLGVGYTDAGSHCSTPDYLWRFRLYFALLFPGCAGTSHAAGSRCFAPDYLWRFRLRFALLFPGCAGTSHF
jgi:hypothetical protein